MTAPRPLCVVPFLALLAACVPNRAPPVPKPAPVLPDVELPAEPPPRGHGRVILDGVGPPLTVVEIDRAAIGTWGSSIGMRLLCRTPCVVDLSYGLHDLRFVVPNRPEARSEALVQVERPLTAVRAQPGTLRDGRFEGWSAYLFVGGGLAAVLAGMGWMASDDGATREVFGVLNLGALAVAAIGVGLWFVDGPSYHPGSSTQWTP